MKHFSDKTENYIPNITHLRGLAALGVCIIHLSMLSGYYSNYNIINAIIDKGQLGVQSFFIISGFILPLSLFKNKYKINQFFLFLYKRIARIDPPFWIIILFYAFFLNDKTIDIKNILLNMFYLVPYFKNAFWYSDVFWTLSIELQFYLILGLTFPLLNNLKPKYQLLILILLCQIILFSKFGHGRIFIIDNLNYFILGYISFLAYIKKPNLYLVLFVISIICLEISVLIAIRFGLISAISILLILIIKPFNFKPLEFLGRISYSLYLCHILTGSFTVYIIDKFYPNQSFKLLISLLISLLFASFYYLIIEKSAIKFSKKISYKGNS